MWFSPRKKWNCLTFGGIHGDSPGKQAKERDILFKKGLAKRFVLWQYTEIKKVQERFGLIATQCLRSRNKMKG